MYGPANASQLDALVLQKREEQKFNSMVEKQLKTEQAKFAQVQDHRRLAESREQDLKRQLDSLQKELYEEERKTELAIEEIHQLEEKSKKKSMWDFGSSN
eukprot:CAMPEP_0184330278 /NCGR_PEP_ID=MMETSP1049-20130417/144598_1 /TAXON_ID=77928 /ORGANISM="Proteomonas sulcata, Strain CCMP704" /LENGTH=99 /DNA_ID=CAMNT_0026652703 /DNA_START=413 /DNA_END=712 /DNA_ORIENTATION=+